MRKDKKQKIKTLVYTALPTGPFELSDKQIEKIRNLGEILLGVGAILGLASVSVIAPNAPQLINKVKWGSNTYRSLASKKRDQKNKIAQTFHYLKRNGLVELIPNKDDYLMKITKKGQEKLIEMNLRTLSIKKPKKWDFSWWIIIADIPTELRSQAHSFREKIKELGLYTLQKSVWVFPFDPRDEINFIAKLNELDQYITTFKASELESEDEIKLKKFFHLKY